MKNRGPIGGGDYPIQPAELLNRPIRDLQRLGERGTSVLDGDGLLVLDRLDTGLGQADRQGPVGVLGMDVFLTDLVAHIETPGA